MKKLINVRPYSPESGSKSSLAACPSSGGRLSQSQTCLPTGKKASRTYGSVIEHFWLKSNEVSGLYGQTLISILLLLSGYISFSQSYNQPLKKGNQLYEAEKYDEAEVQYRKSIEKNKDNPVRGQFNLGDALYKQERYEEASEEFTRAAAMAEDEDIKARALHNLGNSRLQQKKLQEAVEAYKNSLKLNPRDNETRTNLAKAMKQLQQQQQQQKQQQQDGEQQEDQENEQQQEQQGQEENEQPQQGDEEQNQPGEFNEEEGKQPQPREGEISREDAERLLEMLSKEEQKVQKKLNEEKIKERPVETEKDW